MKPQKARDIKAKKWWDELPESDKTKFSKKHFHTADFENLTPYSIGHIFSLETEGKAKPKKYESTPISRDTWEHTGLEDKEGELKLKPGCEYDLYNALKRCLDVFTELADSGHYPHPLMAQNGGEGFGFITAALKKANPNYTP